MKKFLLFALLIIVGLSTTFAQVTTSSMSGTIKDEKGELLIGVTVKATHAPTGTVYGASTNARGLFVMPNMRVGGPYVVQISYVGFNSRTFRDIRLVLGEPYILNATMSDSGNELAEVVVSANRSVLNADRTGAATNVNRQQLATLPTINRSLTDFTRLTPQANGNNFAGRDGRYNNLQIDGANFNNGFGLNSNPLPGGGRAQPISLDAVEELQVNIAPYDVRQSGFTGAGINAVTRSGTNQFSGSAYTFFRPSSFTGRKIYDLELPKQEVKSNVYGFRLGGPIVRNKLFFFANAEYTKNKGTNPNAVNLWTPSTNGVANVEQNIARTTVADLEAVRNHLINQWGYDPGRYEGYANDNGDKSLSLFARLDWNINDRHKLAVRYSQLDAESPSLVNGASGPQPRSGGGNSAAYNRVSQNSIAFENTMYTTKDIVKSVTAELNSTFSSRLSNQVLATYSRIQSKRSSPSSMFPFVDIGDGAFKDENSPYYNYMSFGYELFTYGNDVLNDNYSLVDNLTYLAGKHTITGGFSFEMQKFGNQYIRLGSSYYRYNSVADFLTTGTANEKAPIMFGLTYPYEGQDTYAPIKLGMTGVYVQDKVAVSDRFDLTYGIRAEMPIYMNDLTANSSIDNLKLLNTYGLPTNYDTGSWPKSRVMLSPRVGFNYDVFGDKTLKVRGGTGLFTGRVPFVWLTNMPSNSGVIQNNVELGYKDVKPWIGDIRFNPDPYYWVNNTPASAQNVFIKNPKEGVPSSFALVDRNFKMPKVWRSSLGIDYSIPNTPVIATTDLLYTQDVNAAYQFGANRAAPTKFMNNVGDTRGYYPTGTTAAYNSAVSANTGVVLANTQEKGYAFSATFGLSVPSRNGFYGSVYYTYTKSKDISGNPGSNASSAWSGSASIASPNEQILYNSQYAVPHSVIGNVSYRVEWLKHLASTFSLYYNGSNQGRFSYIYNGDLNGDGLSADLLYLPGNLADLPLANITNAQGQVQFTAAQQLEALTKFVDGDKALKNSLGGYVGRNAALLPWLHRFDFRFLQDIFTNVGPRRHSLQFSLDIMNVGNFLNKEWGISKALNNATNLLVPVGKPDANGKVNFTMRTITENGETVLPSKAYSNTTSTLTTWSMQMGLRYTF